MAWTSLGLPENFTLVGANINQDFTLPVPAGFAPRRLRGSIHAPVEFSTGFVEITDSGGRVLATVNLPAVTPEQAVVPFDVDISAGQVDASELRLSFTVREPPRPPDQRCGLGERVVLSGLTAVLAGDEPAPTSVGNFFPAILQRLTIYAPVDADAAEEQAVLTLASAVTRMYRPQSTSVAVVKQPRAAAPPPAGRFTRSVVVENGDARLAVVNPDRADVYLRVTGRGDQLSEQASLLVNQMQSLVQDPDARVEKAGSRGTTAGDEMTFGQLNLSGETSVLRAATVTTGVDRSALGNGRVDGLRLHLRATHTPVASLDSAALMVKVNDHAVFTTPLGDSGSVDAVVDVPGEFLQQRINFSFDLTFSPRELCTPTTAPLTFQLDPRSTVTAQRGGPPLNGFSAVPSEFSPEFLVALDGSNPNQLDYATRVVAAIARLTGVVLMPRVVDVKAAADASTGALIVANAATVEQLSIQPPVRGESSDVQIDLHDELRIDINRGLASIQTFADEPRNRSVVLVTTSGAWSLVDPLFGYLDQVIGGWSSLDGDVLAAGTEGTVTNLSVGSPDDPATREQGGKIWALWAAIAAGCVLFAALGLGAVYWRRRRRAGDS